MTAGVGMAVNGGRTGTGLPVGAALIGVAMAAATLVAAAALAASLHHLTTTPSSFGATWDRSIASFQVDEPAGMRRELADLPGVDRAAAFLGSELVIGGESTWGVAFEPIDEATPVVHPRITEGREPVGRDEVALGALTLDSLGLRVGDRVGVGTQVVGRQPLEMNVVGVAVMNATDEGSPGLGAVLSSAAFRAVAPEESARIFVVDLADGDAGRAAEAALRASYPNQLSGPVRQQAIRNLERIRMLPWLVGALVAVLAAASLAHALVSSVQRNRGQLAVLATLGFTRTQISAAVAWQASALALAALVAGIPIGLLVARAGWRTISKQLGVATPVIVPVPTVVLVALVALAFAPVVSFLPGRRVGKLQPAEALRSE
jgi:ABC-type lipoprotein release transport system permease subunit